MLKALRNKNGRGPVARTRGITAPWRGLNTRDRLEEQSTEYATILDNFIAENGEITLRAGYSSHATGAGSSVETLLPYATAGTKKLFAAAGSSIFDATSAGAMGSAALSGLTNARWSHVMYGTTSGSWLVIANGADAVRNFNGSSWSTPSITGVSSADLSFVTEHKGRLWFIEKDTLSLWYLAANAIAGTATEFPVGSLCREGGSLLAASSWSLDAGDGQDDLFVLVTSEGEVLVYGGTDPASDYALIGVYRTARPIGDRCLAKYGGELVLLTRSGPVACSELMRAVATEDQKFAKLVRSDFAAAAVSNASAYGWQSHLYTSRGWLMFNVPVAYGGETFRQYVLNEGAWFRFRDMPAVAWAELDGRLYFGAADGAVYQADDVAAEGDNGENITGRVLWAWSRFGSAGSKKFNMARPHMNADAQPTLYMQMLTDYEIEPPTNQPTITDASSGEAWDEAEWDVASWAGAITNYSQWIGIAGEGHVGALYAQIETKSLETFTINAVEVTYETGGIL